MMSQPGAVEGAVLEFHASRANLGENPGINSPLTTSVFDTSGNGHAGTLTSFSGSPWVGNGSISSPHGLTLSGGAGQYVSCGDLGATTLEDLSFTYEALVAVQNGFSGSGYLLCEHRTGSANPLAGIRVYNGRAYAFMRNDAGNARNVDSGVTVADGSIHHIIVSCANVASGFKVVVDNGTPIADTPLSAPFTVTNSGINVFYGGSYGVPGVLYVARIYPFTFTAAQRAQNYAAGTLWLPTPRSGQGGS